MRLIVSSKPVQALKYLILFSATTHLLILALFAIINSDYVLLNYFNILDLDFFFPSIIEGVTSQLLSVATMAALYLFFYLLVKRRSDTSKK